MAEQKTGVWIEWRGGECPVDPDTVVMVKLRSNDDEFQSRQRRAGNLRWAHNSLCHHIIAYMIIPTYVPPAKPKRWDITKMTKAYAGTCVLGAYQYGTVHVVWDRKTGKTKEIPIAIDGDLVVANMFVELLNEVAP